MDYASLEEDEDLHTMWAALLTEAADPGGIEIPPSFPDILRLLSPHDAGFLKAFHEHALQYKPTGLFLRPVSEREKACQCRAVDHELFAIWVALGFAPSSTTYFTLGAQSEAEKRAFKVALDNLVRLRLIEVITHVSIPAPTFSTDERYITHDEEEDYGFTVLGTQFIWACTDRRAAQ